MVSSYKVTVGLLILTLFSTGTVYVLLTNANVKLRVDDDKSTFYVLENSRWVVSGREYNKLFDGSTQLNRRTSGIDVKTLIDQNTKLVTITRTTPYIRGPVIVDTYLFDGNIPEEELFPISHTVEVYNASSFFYRYEVRDLEYFGNSTKLTGETDLTFGRNMKVSLSPGYRWAWVYKTGVTRAQYDVFSDYEVFDVRLFDPPKSQVGVCNA